MFKKLVKKEKFWLALIFLLALILRTYQLGSLPHAFHQDELMNGYVGRFILENGRDLYGNSWPLLYFNRFQDYPNVIPMYWSGLGTLVFGVNEFGVRFPIALTGALMVFPLYFLAWLVFQKKEIALFAAFLLAILPWHIVMSRATAEGTTALTVFTTSLLLLLWGVLKKQRNKILVAFLLAFGCYFLYPSYRLAVPLAIGGVTFFFWQEKKWRPILVVGTIGFLTLTFLISLTTWGKGRYQETSLFYREDMAEIINAKNLALINDLGPNKVTQARIFHNKPIGYGREYFNQFLGYLSPRFLFFQMGPPERYTVPEQGLFYFTTIGLLFLIVLVPTRIKDKRLLIYFFYLLLVAIGPMALTVEDTPNVHRSMLMILPMVIFIGLGYQSLGEIKIGRLSPRFLVFIFLVLEFCYFWFQYSQHTASFKSVVRNDGNREMIQSVIKLANDYDQIYVPIYDTLPVYYLFYTHDFSSELAGQFRLKLELDQVGKVHFIDDWCPTRKLSALEKPEDFLVVESLDGICQTEEGYRELSGETIHRQDETKAYKFIVPSVSN